MADVYQVKTTAGREEVEIRGAKDVPTFYANNIHLQMTNTDFMISFGQIDVQATTKERLVADAVVRIYLAPQQFKAMAELFARNLKRYTEEITKNPPAQGTNEPLR